MNRKLPDEWFRDGTPIAAGWASFRAAAAAPNLSPKQLDAMRKTFYAGALHLWCLIGECVDAEEDEQEHEQKSDRRWRAVNDEMTAFCKHMLAKADKRREQ